MNTYSSCQCIFVGFIYKHHLPCEEQSGVFLFIDNRYNFEIIRFNWECHIFIWEIQVLYYYCRAVSVYITLRHQWGGYLEGIFILLESWGMFINVRDCYLKFLKKIMFIQVKVEEISRISFGNKLSYTDNDLIFVLSYSHNWRILNFHKTFEGVI